MKVIILLGGFGTRLRPLTCNTPKPLLTILNRPSVEYQLELLKRHNIKEVIFCVGYLSKKFKDYFKTGEKFGIKIHYLEEKYPLGTGGAIKNAEKFVDDKIFIFNGDTLTDINLTEMLKFHNKNKSDVTISLIRVKDPTVYGLVEIDKNNRIQRFLEKPSWDEITTNTINAGIYIFNSDIFKYIPPGVNYSVERGLFPLLLQKNKNVYGYVSNSYWLDIGTPEKYIQAHSDLLNNKIKYYKIKYFKGNKYIKVEGKLSVGKKTFIEKYVKFSGFNCIGNNCIIKKASQIINSVILDNTVINEGTKIENSIIGKRCVIQPNVIIESGIIGDNSHISKYSKL